MKPKRKSIWICSSCGNGHVHTTKKAAEECCVCPGCGKPYRTSTGEQVFCPTCASKSALEHARRGLESAANNFMFAKNKFEALEVGQVVLSDPKGPFRPVLNIPDFEKVLRVERKKLGRYLITFKKGKL